MDERGFHKFIEVGAVERLKLEKGNQLAALGKTIAPIHNFHCVHRPHHLPRAPRLGISCPQLITVLELMN